MEKNEIGKLQMKIGDHSAGGTWRLQRLWSFPPTPCQLGAGLMARGEGMIRRGKEVIGRGKGVMTTLDWSLSFDSLGADTKLSYMCINKLKKKQQTIALKHFLKMASAAGILSRIFLNRVLFGKTGYFMLSNVAQGSCQS